MRVLGFDSAGAGASAAVVQDDVVIATRDTGGARGQAEILMPMIAAVLAEAGITATALDLIAVTVGPGSFTGLRIAIAAARGLALAADVPAFGISSFRAVAAQVTPTQNDDRPLVVALDTRRVDFYLHLFDAAGTANGKAVLMTAEDAAVWLPDAPLRVAGDAAARLATALPGHDLTVLGQIAQARAADIARLAAADFRGGIPAVPPRPIYLRAPDVTVPRRTPGR